MEVGRSDKAWSSWRYKMLYVQGVSLRALQPSRSWVFHPRLSLAFSRSDFYNKRTISANPLKKILTAAAETNFYSAQLYKTKQCSTLIFEALF